MSLEPTPAANAARIERLPDLHRARRRHRVLIAFEMEARLLPGQAAMREQPCGLGTLIGDERLVRDFVHTPRQRRPPMRDEPVELPKAAE